MRCKQGLGICDGTFGDAFLLGDAIGWHTVFVKFFYYPASIKNQDGYYSQSVEKIRYASAGEST